MDLYRPKIYLGRYWKNILFFGLFILLYGCKQVDEVAPETTQETHIESFKTEFNKNYGQKGHQYALTPDFKTEINWDKYIIKHQDTVLFKVNVLDTVKISYGGYTFNINENVWLKSIKSKENQIKYYLIIFASYDVNDSYNGLIISKSLNSNIQYVKQYENSVLKSQYPHILDLFVKQSPTKSILNNIDTYASGSGCVGAYVNGILNRVSCPPSEPDFGEPTGFPGNGNEGGGPQDFYPSDNSGGGGGDPSSNNTTVVVFAPTVSINLKERLECFNSVPNNANTKYNITLHVDKTNDFGHTFITLEKSNGNNIQRLSYGYYPETESPFRMVSSAVSPTKSAIGEEDKNIERVSDIRYTLTYNGTAGQPIFQNVINKSLTNETKMYDILKYNCTDYAIDAFNQAISNKIDPNNFYKPSELYNILKKRKSDGNKNVDDTKIGKGKLPKSTSCK